MKRDSDSLMLLEICLAIVFFALSAAVILQVFVGAHQKSIRSETVTIGCLLAEDAVNALQGTEKTAEAFFMAEGYEETEEGLKKQVTVNEREYTLIAENEVEEGTKGQLERGQIEVKYGEATVHKMPYARFVPGEENP